MKALVTKSQKIFDIIQTKQSLQKSFQDHFLQAKECGGWLKTDPSRTCGPRTPKIKQFNSSFYLKYFNIILISFCNMTFFFAFIYC